MICPWHIGLDDDDGAAAPFAFYLNEGRQLLAAGLVDELRLMIYPVILGRGKWFISVF